EKEQRELEDHVHQVELHVHPRRRMRVVALREQELAERPALFAAVDALRAAPLTHRKDDRRDDERREQIRPVDAHRGRAREELATEPQRSLLDGIRPRTEERVHGGAFEKAPQLTLERTISSER